MKHGLFAIGIMGVVIGGFVFSMTRVDSDGQWAKAIPVELQATPVRWPVCTWWRGGWRRTGGCLRTEDRFGHTLSFSFVDADKRVHTRTIEKIEWYDPAVSYYVCYNLTDPSEWELNPSSVDC
jgi:hypothetical protein